MIAKYLAKTIFGNIAVKGLESDREQFGYLL